MSATPFYDHMLQMSNNRLLISMLYYAIKVYDKGRSRLVEGKEDSLLSTATSTNTKTKIQDFKEKTSSSIGDCVAAQIPGHGNAPFVRPELEVTWTSPLRGFTSSLFSLSSSASSLRYRIPHTPHAMDNTHTHTHLPEKV